MRGLDIAMRGASYPISLIPSLRLSFESKGRGYSIRDPVDASLPNQVLWYLLRRKSISALSLWVTDFCTLNREDAHRLLETFWLVSSIKKIPTKAI